MPTISRAQALAYGLGLIVLLTIAGRVAFGAGDPEEARETQSVALDIEEEPPRDLVVHVAGAVLQPGLYRLPDGKTTKSRCGTQRPSLADFR